MLEAGDIDVARNLEPGDLEAVSKNAELATTSAPKGTVYYISLNQKNPNLAKPEVREALKYLVDYDAIGSTLIKGIGEIRQTYQAKGVLGALDSNPFNLRRRQGQGTAGKGRPEGRLLGHHGRAQHPAGDRHCRILPADGRPGRREGRDHSPATASRP
jgi:ABC-type transport system substrate-binding protein